MPWGLVLATAFQVALALLVLFSLFSILWRNHVMNKRLNPLVKSLAGKRYWRINMARQPFFQRWLRIMPFEAKGVLIDEGRQLRLAGVGFKTGEAFDVTLDRSQCHVHWYGRQFLHSSHLYWASLSTEGETLMFCADTGPYNSTRQALVDILRSAFPQLPPDIGKATGFALEKNRRTLTAIGFFVALALFALLDSFIFSPYQLAEAQLAQMLHDLRLLAAVLLGAPITVALLYRWLAGGRVPRLESLALSLLLSMALLGAALPIAKRVDQALATQPAQMYAYRITTPGDLEPVDAALGLPRFKFRRMKEYWAQFPKGAEYQIPLLHGPLGLWQLDHRVFDPPIRAFYEKR